MRIRYSLLMLLFIAPFFSLAQDPIQWEVTIRKIGDKLYDLELHGSIKKGWNVYAEKDEANGLNEITMNWEDETTLKDGAYRIETEPVVYNDPIFKKKLKIFQGEVRIIQPIRFMEDVPFKLRIDIHGFASSKDEFIPIGKTVEGNISEGVSAKDDLRLTAIDVSKPVANCGDKQNHDQNLLTIFLIGFGGGLIALLTPCIFPMIPVTVSFFTGKAKTKQEGIRNGILYGTFIFLIYVLASSPFHLISNINPQIFNTISTNAYVNVLFFVIFILFALSFFGLFEIKLPSAFANKAGSRSGIFFMALTLVIVSFSCTGIILGSLLVNALSSNGSAWQLTAGMGGFGVALALPFGLFAMFPQWLQKLPKSGGWLDVVKKTLAFVELALAIKFLSNADLVEHWGILKREVFIGLWLLIAIGLALYLLKAPFQARRSKGRIAFGCFVVLFALYLIPGLTQTKFANLKLLSGFAPPLSYSIYGKENLKGKGLEPDVINDYEKAKALARLENKPILIDFTGWACVNCRKMEENVWTKPAVSELIKKNYILVSLYVDDKKKMKDGRTVGEKWAAFQEENFKQVTQPLYVLLSPDEKLLNFPVGYTPDANQYKDWLECGIKASEK